MFRPNKISSKLIWIGSIFACIWLHQNLFASNVVESPDRIPSSTESITQVQTETLHVDPPSVVSPPVSEPQKTTSQHPVDSESQVQATLNYHTQQLIALAAQKNNPQHDQFREALNQSIDYF